MAIGYFNNFKKVYYDLSGTKNVIDFTRVTNIMARVGFIKDMISRSELYYEYTIKDTDTPENIADRYYGDPNYFWVVLIFNVITDPQFDWPLQSVPLDNKIKSKYGISAINDAHHYELRTVVLDTVSKTTTNFSYIIDEDTYNATSVYTNENIDDNGIEVSITTTTHAVSNYDYEVNENEAKRKISILKKDYIGQVQNELEKALSR